MKKYIQPTTELIFITPTLMQATSNPGANVDPYDDGIEPGGFEAPKWMGLDDEEDEDEIIHTF